MAKSLREQVFERVAAGMTGLWIRSHEHEEAIEEIQTLCTDSELQWQLATFDVDEGMMILEEVTVAEGRSEWLRVPGYFEAQEKPDGGVQYSRESGKMIKIDKAIKSLPGLNHGVMIGEGKERDTPNALLILKNAHLLIKNPGLIQILANAIWEGKGQGRGHHIVVLSPVLDIPVELKKLFESGIIEHNLPDRSQLRDILQTTARKEEIPEDVDPVIDAAAGLTRLEAENAFALSVTQEGSVKPKAVFQIKANSLKNTAGLALYEGEEDFSVIGGLDFMKRYCLELLQERDPNPKFRATGVLIMGVSGGGKSLFAKALGTETNRPTLCFDMGATLGSLMGQSQQQFRAAFDKAEAMAPCILFGDEIEKMLAGAGDDSKTSGGVKTDLFGHMLSRMQDQKADVFYVMTCNDIRPLSEKFPEFLRRFDDLFFVDFPSDDARKAIWDIHLKGYELVEADADIGELVEAGELILPPDAQWTGAEIEKCCRQARLRKRPVAEVGATMPRISDQATETIQALRNWASGRCYAAEYEDLYDPKHHGDRLAGLLAAGGNGGPRRQLRRKRKSQ